MSSPYLRDGEGIFGRGRVLAVQLAVLLLLIGPQWLVTHDLFNGISTAYAALSGHKDGLYEDLLDANWLLGVGFLKLVFGLADLTGLHYLWVAKLIVTGMMLQFYVEFTLLGERLFGLQRAESRLLGLLCLASPALYTYVGTTVIPNPLCFLLVFIGHRLYWSPRRALRWVGLAVMAMSFQVASNLVFSLALEVACMAQLRGRWRERLPWLAGLFLATLAVYSCMRLVSPPANYYHAYNQLLNPFTATGLRRIVMAVLKFLTWGILPLGAMLVAALAARAMARPAAAQGAAQGGAEGAGQGGWPWFTLALALFLCASAAFPYIAVGKGPALFTHVAIGDGITEQLLRAVYEGPFAPRWGTPTLQHGILFSGPLAMFTWLLARGLWGRLGVWRAGRAGLLLGLLLPLQLVWVLPAYYSQLSAQTAEISIGKGLARVPAPPAGIVDLRVRPVTEWAFWSNGANMIMGQAWGRNDHYGLFHSIDELREFQIWQYHTAFLDIGGLTKSSVQHLFALENYPGHDCISRYETRLPPFSMPVTLLSGWLPGPVPAPSVAFQGTECIRGRVLPNPTPERVVIP